MHGIATILLIELLDGCFTVQECYADNGNTVGSLDNLKKILGSLKNHCPAFGYHLTECHITTQEHPFEKTLQIFDLNEVEIVDGCRVLGSKIGSDNTEKKFVEGSLQQQKLLWKLAFHTNVSPQNVYFIGSG